MEFDNFENVWKRVTAQADDLPEPEPPEADPPKRHAIKPDIKSCAVRFIAGQ